MVDPGFIHVYQRKSAEEIATIYPTEITNFTDATNGNTRTITLNGLNIPQVAAQKWNQFVFRFKLRNDLADNKNIDAVATVSGADIDSASKKLSDGGEVNVLSKGKIIITNRELLYKNYKNNISQINDLWASLYSIAADRRAVIYHIDEYDRDNDDDRSNNITLSWLVDREKLANGTGGNYEYDNDPKTGKEENTINQVSIKIDNLLHDFIDRSGGIGSDGRYVVSER